MSGSATGHEQRDMSMRTDKIESESMSDEHVCEWAISTTYDGVMHFALVHCIVDGCDNTMRVSEAMRRLKATERLSAEDARADASDIWQEHFNQIQEVWDSENNKRRYLYLIAYADIREGKKS